MHGRLKVKTTAQQDAEKKAARAEKLKIYKGAIATILSRREAYDDLQLKMTSGLLLANPDITTLWNIRKEAVLQILKDCDEKKKEDILRHEIDLSQECLLSNPKSYGSWHHRAWCLEKISEPNWQNELFLCNRYLAMDERNFHCWDHRRFVTMKSEISDMDELAYSTERINVNFSNYSAWHYRSKLLPKVFPPNGEPSSGIMEEETRREELELVQNAAFTDPEDSSAWYYHKWLLLGGKAESGTELTMVSMDYENKILSLAFSNLVVASEFCKIVCDDVMVDPQSLNWQPSASQDVPSTLWTVTGNTKLLEANSVSVEVNGTNDKILVTKEKSTETSNFKAVIRPEEKTAQLLEEELSNCNQLLELEPDSKWCRYAKILIMKTLDMEKHYQDITTEFGTLSRLDPMRSTYYLDMKSKFILQTLLKAPSPTLDLSGHGLSCIYFKERFCTSKTINLGNNKLKTIDTLLPYLLKCEKLILDGNPIESFGHEMPRSHLKEVHLKDTPISRDNLAIERLCRAFPQISFLT